MSQAAFAQLSSASAKLVAFQRKKELLDEVERDLDSDLQRLQPAGIVDLQQVVHSGEAAAPPPSSALASWKEFNRYSARTANTEFAKRRIS